MNLVETYVTEILGKPEFKYGKWFLKVKGNCYGSIQESDLMFETEDEALKVEPGYSYMS